MKPVFSAFGACDQEIVNDGFQSCKNEYIQAKEPKFSVYYGLYCTIPITSCP